MRPIHERGAQQGETDKERARFKVSRLVRSIAAECSNKERPHCAFINKMRDRRAGKGASTEKGAHRSRHSWHCAASRQSGRVDFLFGARRISVRAVSNEKKNGTVPSAGLAENFRAGAIFDL